jgi:hypothetical protein
MNEKLKEIQNDYLNFSNLSQNSSLSEDIIFKKIAKLDDKYKNNEIHFQSFEGVLSNVGFDQASIKVLNYVIKRLKSKKDKLPQNKYFYDIGNTILSKSVLIYKAKPNISTLISTRSFLEAKKYFYHVVEDDTDHYERARTNITNILGKYGRNYEALYAYDDVIKKNPLFGMALGNKAIALKYYIKLSPKTSLVLLNNAYELLINALKDKKINDIGGKLAINIFTHEKKEIEQLFKKIKYKYSGLKKPENLTKYQHFILENNLYLNYDFGFYYDKNSLRDTFFPNFIENLKDKKTIKSRSMSEKIYYSFHIFNQLLEDFTTARYNYFHAINIKFNHIDKKVNYIYTLDYTRHSLKYGLLKSVFSSLYNCFDKIAHLMKYYFCYSESDINNTDIYFDWLTSENFKKIIIKNENFQFLALHNLALDFKENHTYNYINKLRNRITHSFLNINVGEAYNEKYETFEITEDRLIKYDKKLFIIVKAAIMYSVLAIYYSNFKERSKLFKTIAISENEIF